MDSLFHFMQRLTQELKNNTLNASVRPGRLPEHGRWPRGSKGPRASFLAQGSSVDPGGDGGGLRPGSLAEKCRSERGAPPRGRQWQACRLLPGPCDGRAGGRSGWAVPTAQSCASSERHLSAWSLCASGRIWLRIPPSRLDVASVARMRGLTTVGGSWRITPPTAPVSPFCS